MYLSLDDEEYWFVCLERHELHELWKMGKLGFTKIRVLRVVDQLMFIMLNYGHLVCLELRIDENWWIELRKLRVVELLNSGPLSPVDLNGHNKSYTTLIGVRTIGDET